MLKIKTSCGIKKYNSLKKKKGFFNTLRLYWFLVIGGLRDVFK